MSDKRTIHKILATYEIAPQDALWEVHGKTIMYHRYVELAGARAGVTFDMPVIVESNSEKKIAVMIVTGHMDERSEWSTGEASPSNNKNPYPFAMAEKRAKDRVILKLLGLHGEVYSSEEADDFKGGASPAPQGDNNNATLYASERMEKLVWAMLRKAKTQFGADAEAKSGKTWTDLEAWVRDATRAKGARLTMKQFDGLKDLFITVGVLEDRK